MNEIIEEYNNHNINNIKDLFKELKNLILLERIALNNKNIYGLSDDKIYGELHVYSDRMTPTRFIKK